MASVEVTAYDTRLAGWNFSWNLTEKEFSDFKERLDDDLKGIGDESDKILGNAKVGKYGIQIEYIGSDPDNPIDLTFYRLAETDRYANKNDWTTADDSEKYWMSLTADEVRGADFDTFKERIEDKIYKFIMTQTDYGRSPDGTRMLKEDVLCPVIVDKLHDVKKEGSMFEELEKYAREANRKKAELDAAIKKDRETLEAQRKRLVKETKEFLISLCETRDRIFPDEKPDIWPYSRDMESDYGPGSSAEILPAKTSGSSNYWSPKAVSVGIRNAHILISLYKENPEEAKEEDKKICIGKAKDIYDELDNLSTEKIKWIIDNRDVIKEAFSRTAKRGIDELLKDATREKDEIRQRLTTVTATPVRPGQEKETSSEKVFQKTSTPSAKAEKKVMTEKQYKRLKNGLQWLQGWVEHAEFNGMCRQEREDAKLLLDQVGKLIDRKWERERPQENTKPVPIKKKEPDCGYER